MQGYKREVFPGDAFHKWRRVDLRRPASWPAAGTLAVMCQTSKEYHGMNHYTAGWPVNSYGALYFRAGMGGGLQLVSNIKKYNDIWFYMAQTPSRYFSLADPKTWPEVGKPVILKLDGKDGKDPPKYAAGHFEKQQTRTLWWFHDNGNERATDLTRKYYIQWEYLPEFDGAPYAGQG